jgi:hypothetical protein
MPPAVYITYFELFDRHPSLDELKTIIRELNARETVVSCARLNTMFRSAVEQGSRAMVEFQAWFTKNFLDSDTRERLMTRFGTADPSGRPVCHPLQLLNIMRQAFIVFNGDEDAPREYNQNQLGLACLMMNDLFCSPEEREDIRTGSESDRKRHLRTQLLPALEISRLGDFRNLYIRSYFIYYIALQQKPVMEKIRKECEELDLAQEFQRSIGIPLIVWLNLVTGLYTVLIKHSLKEFATAQGICIVNRKTIITNPKLTFEQIDRFFDLLSMNFTEMQSEFQKDRQVDDRFDLTPFMVKPFLNLAPDLYICSDLGLLLEKLNNGPYYLITDRLPRCERKKVFKAWGFLFEAYVNWLLEPLSGRNGANYYSDTHWEDDGSNSFDAVFVKSRVVIALEFKSGFLKQTARYSNDVDQLEIDVEKKIAVGCRQLARDISQLFPEAGSARVLKDIPIPGNTLWVLPVLVVQDLALRTPFINEFLNKRFQLNLKEHPVKACVEVLPLNVIQISDLETLVEMADGSNLSIWGFLQRRCREDPSMARELFELIEELPEAKKPPSSARFNEIFSQSLDEMCANLFCEIPPEQRR